MANLRQLRWLPVASLAIPLVLLVACGSVTDQREVTNTDFAAFVEATGYVTYREQEGGPQNWRSAFTEGKDNHPELPTTSPGL
jgi:hypothetical protein